MATAHESIAGHYDQKSYDSSEQADNKFTKSSNKPTDDLPKPSDKGSQPVHGA